MPSLKKAIWLTVVASVFVTTLGLTSLPCVWAVCCVYDVCQSCQRVSWCDAGELCTCTGDPEVEPYPCVLCEWVCCSCP